MPTYQYHCPACSHSFEEFQSITDDPIEVCPNCQGKTHRVISGGSGFLLKGSGFYATDYRSKQYRAEAAKDKPSSAASESASTGSSEKKPSDKPSARDS
ncbi:MAG TPA: zinc ribbon domain-containing protein [Acidobacteriota bacterium]|nr:zinc ribbon domain-containing protein [Acidobacteriota bacterium]